ncbi:MAG: methylenetetrahydrofolate reductase C-terminal domain-containing protein [Candidatus Rokuibacteriota bacterium]
MSNALREALAAGRFCYMVELVASALKREAQVLEVASELAGLKDVVAGSITSYAGGSIGHDPIRVGTAARARGLAPNVHLTCVSQDRWELRKTLEDLHALGIENVFALTGDYPASADASQPAPIFDLDSVQLVRLIGDLRQAGMPFHVAVAVSPFKYLEADCVYQYVKLEKKIAAGADLAITQVGWDVEKFRELRRYMDERGLRTPVLGSVYVLTLRAAERMATGQPPGCWVPPALLDVVRSEQAAPDRGRRARLERAARTAAVLRGLGYAGAYIGGTHDAVQVAWIIRRAAELAPQWERFVDDLRFGDEDGFYLYRDLGGGPMPSASAPVLERLADARPSRTSQAGRRAAPAAPSRRAWGPWALDRLGQFFPVTGDTWLRRGLAHLCAWIDRRPRLAHVVERLELAVKRPAFGCQACGNCVLGVMEYVCPQTCPKQMRNGPCGGTNLGRCEVVDRPCIWVSVYERAQANDRLESLRVYVPPPDRARAGTSSWINYFLERDSRPDHGH